MHHHLELRLVNDSDEAFLKSLNEDREVQDRIGHIGMSSHREGYLRIIERDGAPLGIVGIMRSGALDGECVELICAVGVQHQRGGVATEACKRLLAEYARAPAPRRILACIAEENDAGRCLAKKLGFESLDVRRLLSNDIVFEFSTGRRG